MPDQSSALPAERARRDSAPTVASSATAAPQRPAPSTGAVRVLQNRRAPAQLSLFQRALPAR